jgi:3-(3-hydroxy-phenyl)propionate hydroxylase
MHDPPSTARASVYYPYQVHSYRRPPEMDGEHPPRPVVIVGAGPIGLATALDLARFGVRSVVLEEDLQVCEGSRATVLTRRSLEILQQIGVERPFIDKGLPWMYGRSFFRGVEVYRMVMPHDPDDRYLPGLNIQQQYMEQFLLGCCEREPLIELRWGQRVIGLSQSERQVMLMIDTPEGEYALAADWVVAADGGRSTVRRLMQLRMEGRAYSGQFVIADIKAKIDLPTERLCFFDPPWIPGNNVLVHRQPDQVWRIDYRLPDSETREQALEPALLTRRIDAVLQMIHQEVEWQLDWATVYSVSALTLSEFVHGRVLFVGDAAHVLPIFGVRGINTGIQDSNNLAWKLAFVVRRLAEPALLESYSRERVRAAREICEEAGKSTRFMTPPSAGTRLMRDAVLSFSLSEDFLKDLMHWRTARAHDYLDSKLNACPQADAQFEGGIGAGQPLRNVKLAEGDYLLDRFGSKAGFHLMLFESTAGLSGAAQELLAAARNQRVPVHCLIVARTALAQPAGCSVVDDPAGRIFARYAAAEGTAYLIRPDLHVCARWRRASAAELLMALRRATGEEAVSTGDA